MANELIRTVLWEYKLFNYIFMPLRFLRILKRLIGGEVVNDALFRVIVLTHNVHGIYVFSLHVPKDCSSVVMF